MCSFQEKDNFFFSLSLKTHFPFVVFPISKQKLYINAVKQKKYKFDKHNDNCFNTLRLLRNTSTHIWMMKLEWENYMTHSRHAFSVYYAHLFSVCSDEQFSVLQFFSILFCSCNLCSDVQLVHIWIAEILLTFL